LKNWLAHTSLQLISYLPLSVNQRIGRIIGFIGWYVSANMRKRTLLNLDRCYPDKSKAWKTKVGREALCSSAEALLETPTLWKAGKDKIASLLLNPESLETIKNTYAKGDGLIVVVLHLGSWEYLGLITAMHTKTTSAYRPLNLPALNELVVEGRQSTGARLVPSTFKGIRELTKALSNKESICILPDQEPRRDQGIYADFFGKPAYTTNLMPKLAARHNTPVLYIAAERKRNGYYLHIEEGVKALYDKDLVTACNAMNSQIETMINKFPEQYSWSYKRFKRLPDGTNLYS